MTDDLKDCLAPLRPELAVVESDEQRAAQAARIVPHLSRYIQDIPRQRARRRRFGVGALLAAALATASVALFIGTAEDSANSDYLTIRGELKLDEGDTWISGEGVRNSVSGTVETLATAANISTRSGLQLRLAPATRAKLDGLRGDINEQQVYLQAGEVNCEVPPLGNKAQFSVVTPDARVVVHGTKFSVEVREQASGGATHTCVRVTEGKVAVHTTAGRTFLTPGQSQGCDPQQVAQGSAVEGSTASAEMEDGEATSPVRNTGTPAARNTLAMETRLLQSALAAERKGDRAGARAFVQRLLRQYPNSPLRQEAETTLDRLQRD